MNIQELLGGISDRLAATATVNSVYGAPVKAGDRTVIPIATVRFGFGGGGGSTGEDETQNGGGGGGGVVAKPRGALEITPQWTRFVPFVTSRELVLAFGAGLILGALIGAQTGRKRIEVIQDPAARRRR